MKKRFAVCAGFLLAIGFVAPVVPALAAEAQQVVHGVPFHGELGNVVSDVLVSDKAQSEKITAAYDKTKSEMLPKMQEQQKALAGLSKEEQAKKTQEMDAQFNAAFQANLKGTLSDKELELVKPVLDATQEKHPESMHVAAELRSLRAVDLKPEQRTALQPFVQELLTSTLHEPSGEKSNPQKAAEYTENVGKAQKTFKEKANAILSDAQKAEWKTKEAAVREELKKKPEKMELKAKGAGVKEEKASAKTKVEKVKKEVKVKSEGKEKPEQKKEEPKKEEPKKEEKK